VKKGVCLFCTITIFAFFTGYLGETAHAGTASCQSKQEGKFDCMEFSGNLLAAPLKQVCTPAGGLQWVDSPCPQVNVLGYCDVPRTDSIRQRVYCYHMADLPDTQRIEYCRMGCNGTFSATQGNPSAPQTGAGSSTPSPALKSAIGTASSALKPAIGTAAPVSASLKPTNTPSTAAQYSIEQNTNRFGEDYKDLSLATPDPALCAQACINDAKCKAWTYVKPGVQADRAVCWLKDKVAPPTPDNNCVSGVKGTGSSGGGTATTGTSSDSQTYSMESNIDMPGDDYKDFDLKNPDPQLCAQTCMNEAKCKAWTYVKPGVQADSARCWLKVRVPSRTQDENCVSGVKGAGSSGGGTTTSGTLPGSQNYSMETNIDLPGEDYKDLDLNNPDPSLCAQACINEAKCKAWTYVKPSVLSGNAKCWLKDKIPSRVQDESCVSGIKGK
jgi:hypothetical protein